MALEPPRKNRSQLPGEVLPPDSIDWVRIAAASSLIAGGLFYIAGERRAGIAAAATGTALAMIDQQEVLRSWWRQLPGYVDQIQHMLDDVQTLVEDITGKRDRLREVLGKVSNAI
jgi:hypothetical protein